MTTPRPHPDAGHTSDMGLTLCLLIVGLVLAWAANTYGWLGIEPVPDQPATPTSTHR